jgi:1-deoxy-D-xylulose-5-phosphate reductoisomerase
MTTITPAEALKHPTWNMGRKISVDSATLMNKGFEVIEAAHLFHVPVDSVRVVVHPQSAIHSMVEYTDGSVIAHLGATDMYLPIQNVLLYPDRLPNRFPSLNLAELATITFETPDRKNFPCLDYAYESARRGETFPAVLNAANEIAVERFLNSEISFLDIPRMIGKALEMHAPESTVSLDSILEADQWARDLVSGFEADWPAA